MPYERSRQVINFKRKFSTGAGPISIPDPPAAGERRPQHTVLRRQFVRRVKRNRYSEPVRVVCNAAPNGFRSVALFAQLINAARRFVDFNDHWTRRKKLR